MDTPDEPLAAEPVRDRTNTDSHIGPEAAVKNIPTWALIVCPVMAAALSNADVLFVAFVRPNSATDETKLALFATIPLSLAACGLTLWFLLKLRREVDRRGEAEQSLREAFMDLGRSLNRERLLRRELDHRVRNNLSALLGLVGMYEDKDASTSDIVSSLRGKIITLREAYTLIADTHGEGIELADLLHAIVEAILKGEDAASVMIEGPSVRLTSREANAFAMIAQELLTNATKHGALRQRNGSIHISWDCLKSNKNAQVRLRWIEELTDGEGTKSPHAGGGIGLSLIQGFAESDLRGSVEFRKTENMWSVYLIANIRIPAAEEQGTKGRINKEVCV